MSTNFIKKFKPKVSATPSVHIPPSRLSVSPSSVAALLYSGMTKNNPMTASKRQRKSKKHCAASKQYGKTKKPLRPTPPEIENDCPSQNEP
ncbi:hypothetical protein LguiA_026074 [Lonicera macranthoides]